jgi:hypothetical protein
VRLVEGTGHVDAYGEMLFGFGATSQSQQFIPNSAVEKI